jgi:hypothetical protein
MAKTYRTETDRLLEKFHHKQDKINKEFYKITEHLLEERRRNRTGYFGAGLRQYQITVKRAKDNRDKLLEELYKEFEYKINALNKKYGVKWD